MLFFQGAQLDGHGIRSLKQGGQQKGYGMRLRIELRVQVGDVRCAVGFGCPGIDRLLLELRGIVDDGIPA